MGLLPYSFFPSVYMYARSSTAAVWDAASYVAQQALWLITIGMQLVHEMGVGVKWVFMTLRCIVFALLDMPYFLPHVFWYLLTPTVIRRVAYRSSRKTKLRNMELLLARQVVQPMTPQKSSNEDKDNSNNSSSSNAAMTAATAADKQHRKNRRDVAAEAAAAATIARAVETSAGDGAGDAALTAQAADLLSNVNLADGSFMSCLPADYSSDVCKLNMTNNSSFDEALSTLQRACQRHYKKQQKQQQQQQQQQQQHGEEDGAAVVTRRTHEQQEEDEAAQPATAARHSTPVRQEGELDQSEQHRHDGAASPHDNQHKANDDNGATTTQPQPQPRTSKAAAVRDFLHSFAAPHTDSDVDDGDDTDEDDEEDKMNLHNRATLDIFLPVPLDTLFRFMDQERKSCKRNCRPLLKRKKFPIIILINGGAWIVGCYLWNVFLARVLAARGYVVFCPDYRNFPQTTMEGMTLDVSDAIAWVLSNADRYNGDLDDVTLLGQSAGAHLTMLSLLSQAQLAAYEANGGSTAANNVPAPSNVAYNVARYNPRQSIHCFIGLGGIYNVRNLVRHFDKRGLYRKVLYKIAGGRRALPRYTISYYFDEYRKHETGEVLPDNIFDFLPRHMYFLHGDADKSAPISESANLVYLMRNTQRDALVHTLSTAPEQAKTRPPPVNVEYIFVPGTSHTDAIIEEPVYCGVSHVAEFLSFYKYDDDEHWHAAGSGAAAATAAALSDGPAAATLSTTREPNQPRGDGNHSRSSSDDKDNNNNNKNNNNDSRSPAQQPGLSDDAVTTTSSSSTTASATLRRLRRRTSSLPDSAALALLNREEDPAFPVMPVKQPDGILLTPLPHSSRPWLLRLASWVNPF